LANQLLLVDEIMPVDEISVPANKWADSRLVEEEICRRQLRI
jgi:hypothetical protein